MFHVTLRGIQGHVVRLLLTAFAVMLGVSFVTGTLVLRGSIDQTVQGLLTQASKGTDVMVRGAPPAGNASGTRPSVPLALVDVVSRVPGAARVMPNLQGTALLAGQDGTPVRNGGAPGLGFAFQRDDPSFTLVEGRGPTAAGEVAVESSTLTKSGLAVGDRTKAVIGGQVRDVTITGEVHFGSLFGATAILVDPASARTLFAPDGLVHSIAVTASRGTSQADLRTAVARVVPPGVEAVTGDVVAAEDTKTLQTGLGFFTIFLMVFAGVALFVGSFIIVNTFSMLVGQRTRELAVLRAIGASRRQVMRAVLGEALAIGVVGSALGIGLGLLIAAGAKSAIRSYLGADIGTELPLSVATVLLSILVGVGVTVIAAALPARRGASVAPVAAMRGGSEAASGRLGRRTWTGSALVALGASTLVASVTRTDVPWPLAGAGAVVAVVGMLVVAPAVTRPFVSLITLPFVRGVVGRLARENALRAPRRTATTASALMIGLALIAGLSVVAESVKASVQSGVNKELTSDFVLNGGTAPVAPPLAVAAANLPDVAAVAAISRVDLQIGRFSTAASATTASGIAGNVSMRLVDGRLDSLGISTILVDQTTAQEQGWKVGDTLTAAVGTIPATPVIVGGIFADRQAFGSHVIVDRSLYAKATPVSQQSDVRVFIRAKPGADLSALHSALVGLARPYLVVSVQDGAEFADAEGASVDTLLNLLYVLLLFSIIVAVLGIINTLALSVVERTREIGLLRAIGLRRRQLGGMITVEAIATAVFGAALGSLVGLGLGVALQHGLASQGLTTLAVPWTLIAAMVVSSALVGVLAAALPSVRAVRLDVLDAIAHG